MKLSLVICAVLLAVVAVNSSPVVKREAATDDLSPLNETDEDERSDRDKRKIGVVKLGVSNGIINFVFGKLDAFLDAKTKALAVLDEGNKAKNAAFEIDNTKSATSEFINKFLAQKLKAASGSVGPLLNAGTTFLSSAKQGLTGAFISKFAPLSSIAGGLAGGLAGASGGSSGGDDSSNGGGSNSGSFLTGILGSLSGSSGNLSGGGSSGTDDKDEPESYPIAGSADANASAGFANLGGGKKTTTRRPATKITTTTEDIPEFDRTKVSLDIPPQVIGGGFTLLTNISKVISSLIMNSAKRTASVLELFKPLFRGTLSIKGVPLEYPK